VSGWAGRIPRQAVAIAKLLAILALIPLALVDPVIPAFLGTAIILLGWAPALTELLAALRPLLLPLIVAVAVGAFALEVLPQIVVGVVVGVVLIPWAARDWARSGRVIASTGEVLASVLRWLISALVVIPVVAAVIKFVPGASDSVGGALEKVDELGGVAIALAVLAFLAWAVAIVLRMVGYTRSYARGLVAGLLVATAIRFLMEEDLLGGKDAFGWLPLGWLAGITAVSLVVLVALEALAKVWEEDWPHPAWLRWFAIWVTESRRVCCGERPLRPERG
jgi:hypothetical protein